MGIRFEVARGRRKGSAEAEGGEEEEKEEEEKGRMRG